MWNLTRQELFFGLIGLLVCAFFTYFDLRLTSGVATSISYVSILGFGLLARSRRLTVLFGLLGIAATLYGLYMNPAIIDLAVDVTNRQLVIIAIVTITITSHIYMTKQEEFDAKLYKVAATDELTGIANRRALLKELEKRILEAMRYNSSFSILLFDLDDFKAVNDKYGHLVGDKILIRITRICATWLRTTDLFGRYGGEEFLILCPNTTMEGAKALGERIRQAIEQADFTVHDNHIRMTISVGATNLSNHLDKSAARLNELELSNDMIDAADSAMYRAKHTGKNRLIAYEPETGQTRQTAEL